MIHAFDGGRGSAMFDRIMNQMMASMLHSMVAIYEKAHHQGGPLGGFAALVERFR